MQGVTIEDVGPCKKRIKIEIAEEQIKNEVEKNYSQLQGSLQLPGFRQGHVPRRLIERRFVDRINDEVKQSLISSSYADAVSENNLSPVGAPEFVPKLEDINISPDTSLSFEVTVEVKPSFDIDNYKGLQLEKKPIEVTQEDMDQAIENLRRERANIEPVEKGKVEEGDFLIVDCEVLVGDEAVLSEKNVPIDIRADVVMGVAVENLAKSVIGAKPGKVCDLKGKIPDTFEKEEFREKDAAVKLTINDIKRPVLPELNDEFAKLLRVESLDQLKEHVNASLLRNKNIDAQEDIVRQMHEKLLDLVSFEVPADMVERQATDILERRIMRLQSMGVPPEKLEEEKERLRGASKDDALRQCKIFFILETITEKENITATDAEVEQYIAQLAAYRGVKPMQLSQRLEREDRIDMLRSQLRDQKTEKFLLDNAVIAGEEKEKGEAD